MKKVLMVNEFSYLSTGYSTYGREILKRIHNSGKFEVAELGCYVAANDSRLQHIPWKVYPNLPDSSNEEQKRSYDSSSTNVFGEWSFGDVCLDYQPDIVFDIRDFWMLEFQDRCPYRPYFKWVIMPTVDAYPQNKQWISTYCNADAVLTYTDWSGKVLKSQCGDSINWVGSASPSASSEYKPIPNRIELKRSLGLGDVNIVGTVMRNQRRKLYPELFESFRKYLDKSKHNTILYCHTSYPDRGWDIPDLLKEYSLSGKVYFTYVCAACGFAFPDVFQDALIHCKKCNSLACGLTNVQRGVNPATLANIINIFDVYVQYANCEGFGLPQVEAAACGVPVIGTDYSAMSDVIRKLEGYPIPPKILYKELETGCNRAYPDCDAFVDILTNFFKMPSAMRERKRNQARMAFESNYSWDKTANKWMEVFDSIEPVANGWKSSPRIFNPAPFDEHFRLNNVEYARWLIKEVLHEPERLNTYMESRLIKDLNYQVYLDGISGMYYNEQSHLFGQQKYNPFDRKKAYEMMYNLCIRRNEWEHKRINTV